MPHLFRKEDQETAFHDSDRDDQTGTEDYYSSGSEYIPEHSDSDNEDTSGRLL